MANNILKYKGLKIGNSLYEKNIDYIIEEIFAYAEKNKCKIYFPKDVKIGKKLNDKSFEKNLKDIEDDDMILDVGSKTLVEIKGIIDDSSTILWNGPLGYFENENFSIGSSEIAKYIANRGDKIFSVVGGGDTVAVINSLNINNKFDFVSTAGGAFLEFLEGKVLPGIKALN
jgi:phosphoglycerate kinase